VEVVSEHETPIVSPQSESAPQGQQSTVRHVLDLLSRSKKAREKYDKQWQANYEFVFGGKQWNVDRPRWRFSEVANLTWATIMTEVGIQTDARPKFEFGAREPSDFDFAQQLSDINNANWERYGWMRHVTDSVLMCKWVHVVHCECYWDPNLEDGLGDVALKVLDPFGCYWDPNATDITDSEYFLYVIPIPTKKLKYDYPEFADKIKPDIETLQSQYNDVTTPTQDRMVGKNVNVRPFRDNDRFGGEPMTQLIRIWMKDSSTEEKEEEQDGQKVYVKRLRFPKGRYIELCNNMVLVDGPNGVRIGDKIVPYKDGEFPIARLVNYSLPLEYAGENEVTHLRGPARMINYFRSSMADALKQNGSPHWIIGAGAGLDPDQISNEPGQKLVVNDANQVRVEAGVGIASGMQYLNDQNAATFDRISGMGDVIKGIVDPAVTSGLLFDGYVEAAQVRPRLKNRNLDLFLQRLGRLALSRYLQFYTAPRVFRITAQPGFPSHVSFFVSEGPQGQTIANVSSPLPNGAMGPVQQGEIKGIPDVIVQTGSSLPFAKAQKSKTAMEFFSAGAIDQEALLEVTDFPKRDQVLARMQKAAAEQAQMQAQQGGVAK
jgi:hypothetical protein